MPLAVPFTLMDAFSPTVKAVRSFNMSVTELFGPVLIVSPARTPPPLPIGAPLAAVTSPFTLAVTF
jgi:hypothetical protein